jgi:DNA polymerase III subunit epsilon
VVVDPAASLAQRAVAYLETGPAASGALVREVLGLSRTPRGVAERLAATLLGADPRVTRTPDGRWTLVRGDPSPTLDACRFAVVDVEATGPSPAQGGRIIELAVVELAAGGPRLALETLVQPGQPIAPAVARLTGITDAVVRDAPRFGAVADRLVEALRGRVFVAHHVQFDWGLVAAELARSRALLLAGPRLCTVRLARRLLPPLASRTLEALARYFGFAIAGRHRAGPDAWAAARILAELLGLARARGATTLADVLALRAARRGRGAGARTQAPAPAPTPAAASAS